MLFFFTFLPDYKKVVILRYILTSFVRIPQTLWHIRANVRYFSWSLPQFR